MKAEYVDHMGSDLRVVDAARVSFDKQSEWKIEPGKGHTNGTLDTRDAKLIRYLATHNHWTPFSHCSVTLRETVPIFVARQRFKHMVGFAYNEVSRRYVDDEPDFYYPDRWRGRPEGSVKQGSGLKEFPVDYPLIEYQGNSFDYDSILYLCEIWYKTAIAHGIAPEMARMILPQSMYTSYYVTGSLAAWARAYKLRVDPHAQQEIQELAKMWGKVIEPLFPVSWKALTE